VDLDEAHLFHGRCKNLSSEPDPGDTSSRPERQARGKSPRQERSRGETNIAPGHGPQTGVADASKPRSQSRRTWIRLTKNTGHPTKINRDARLDEQARGPGRSEMIDHPAAGANLRRALKEPHERRWASRGKDHSPGQAAKARIGSGTPRQSNARCMTDCRAAN
jgi:hypothetical protein